MIDHFDGLYGTFAQAFIAVFAARIFEIEIANHARLLT